MFGILFWVGSQGNEGPSVEVTGLLNRWSDGDASALPELARALYPQWRRMAQSYFQHEKAGHMLQATALVHEAYVALTRMRPHGFESRYELQALIGKLMRQILVDHARRVRSAKRGDGIAHVPVADALDAADGQALERANEFLVLHEALDKLQGLHERMARVVELHFFAGLTQTEVSESMGISTATVNRELRMAKAWLNTAINDPLPKAP